jgi:hypothetical protein
VKSDLSLIIDKDGKSLSNYFVTIDNDEIYIKNLEDEFFEYRIGKSGKSSEEVQRVQETIFNEKKRIIEKTLFGVDINSNSVKICRLRLWIELLKHSYFTKTSGFKELKTLPNIDINIKLGNSLIHRFPLTDNIKEVLKKSNVSVKDYLEKVTRYKETDDKKDKREIQSQVDTIKKNLVKELNFELKKKYSKIKGQVDNLEHTLNNLKLILTKKIDWELIEQQYDQMVKYATALRLGTAETESILKRFTKNPVKHPAYLALHELGKAIKTIFLCRYLVLKILDKKLMKALMLLSVGMVSQDLFFTERIVNFLLTDWKNKNCLF